MTEAQWQAYRKQKERNKKEQREYQHSEKGKAMLKKSQKKYHRSKRGKIINIYGAQVRLSKERGHNPPAYTKDELVSWCLKQRLYHKLHEIWTSSGYMKALAPSVDRIDPKKGYAFGNIHLMTAYQNTLKGMNEAGSKRRKRVIQIEIIKTERAIKIWPSILAASKGTGQNNPTGIQKVLKGNQEVAGGYKWQYAD